jgi:hypothetical protein
MPIHLYTMTHSHRPDRCLHCGGSMYPDPVDECWVCMMCARPVPIATVPAPVSESPGPDGADRAVDATAAEAAA